MEIEIRKGNKAFLKNVPFYEEWHGEAGKTLISERLFVLAHEGSIEEIELSPTYRIGSNYAYTEEEQGQGQSYEASIRNAGFDPSLKMNSFLIIRREFRNWSGQESTNEISIILVEDSQEE